MGKAVQFVGRLRNRCRREIARRVAVKSLGKASSSSYISFSFDDFPHSAADAGSAILERHGVRGTFYVCMGLLNNDSPVGQIASLQDITALIGRGHEIGGHTYDHQNPRSANPRAFEASLTRNSQSFKAAFPLSDLLVFAYPIEDPSLKIKGIVGSRFLCCRGGGQRFNELKMDLNLLSAFFLDRRTGVAEDTIKRIIDRSVAENGWLIFATHDIADDPSEYGCTPKMLESVVKHAAASGARLATVGKACAEMRVK